MVLHSVTCRVRSNVRTFETPRLPIRLLMLPLARKRSVVWLPGSKAYLDCNQDRTGQPAPMPSAIPNSNPKRATFGIAKVAIRRRYNAWYPDPRKYNRRPSTPPSSCGALRSEQSDAQKHRRPLPQDGPPFAGSLGRSPKRSPRSARCSSCRSRCTQTKAPPGTKERQHRRNLDSSCSKERIPREPITACLGSSRVS